MTKEERLERLEFDFWRERTAIYADSSLTMFSKATLLRRLYARYLRARSALERQQKKEAA